MLTIVDQDQLRAAARPRLRPGRVPVATTASAACRRRTKRSPSSSTAGWSATSRPRPSARSRAATRTGAGRSGFRPRFLLIESLRKLGKAYGPNFQRARRRRRAARPITFPDMAQRHRRSADPHLHARRHRPAAGLRRRAEVPGRSALARSYSVLRILSRRQRRRPGRQPPDRLDGAGRLADRRVAEVTDGQKRKKAKRNRPAINEFLFPLFVPRAMAAVSCRARRRPYQERGGPPVAQMRPKFRRTWRQRPVKRRLPIVDC